MSPERPGRKEAIFGREWRERRLHRALLKRSQLEEKRGDPEINHEDLAEAVRITQWAVWSLFMDTTRRGEPDEIKAASKAVGLLREAISGEVFPNPPPRGRDASEPFS
jgi:hypothetical protein